MFQGGSNYSFRLLFLLRTNQFCCLHSDSTPFCFHFGRWLQTKHVVNIVPSAYNKRMCLLLSLREKSWSATMAETFWSFWISPISLTRPVYMLSIQLHCSAVRMQNQGSFDLIICRLFRVNICWWFLQCIHSHNYCH